MEILKVFASFITTSLIKTKKNLPKNLKSTGKGGEIILVFFVFPEGLDFARALFTEKVDFNNATVTELANFREAKFVGVAYFPEITFIKGADFSGATFNKGANFGGAVFTEGAHFAGATFTEGASFFRTKFNKKATFKGATFIEAVDFRDATFAEEANFLGAKFNRVADFSGAVFTEAVDFRDATFKERVHFKRATFTKGAKFSGAPSSNEADFDNVTFTEVADYRGVHFIEDAKFVKTTFIKKADFNGATFTKKADFNGAIFTEEADFGGTTFIKEVSFDLAKFTEVTSFDGATFAKRADFGGTTFNKKASFGGTKFIEWVNFGRVKFTKRADFTGATFSKGVNFWSAIFQNGDANFRLSRFLGRTIFAGRKEYKSKQNIYIFGNIKVDFRNVDINPPNAIIFRNADLSQCLFQATRVDKIEFTGVKWAKIPPKSIFSRTAVYDEKNLLDSIKSKKKRKKKDKENLDWEHIERVCRDLKTNHKESGDHERAGDFHYGEKEMRRRNPSTPPMHRFFLNLYRILSGYGERYLRPLLWTLVVLAGCTIVYMFLGIAPKEGAPFGIANIECWFKVSLYSLQVMTLQKPTEIQPIGVWSTAIKTFQSIVGPVLIGLFALALRQRLKR